MRVLHVDSGREMRGGQWQALRLHRGLVALGHESLLLGREDSPLLLMAAGMGLPCGVFHPLRVPSLARRFDLAHAHDAHSHTLLALLSPVPIVVSRRVAFPVKRSPVSRWKYRRPSRYLAVSRFVAGQLLASGVPESRISVVYDGVSAPAEPAHGDAILAPYTLDPGKGMALAEQGASLAGVCLRRSTNLEADLPGARALVYLSQSEGLGSGILLAMAHGVTVIASQVGGIPELIEDGVTGILVPNDPEAVARAFARVNRQIGLAARQSVLQRFTEEHMIRATVAAYGQVLNA